mmetsp:Transcript_26814/g.63717  ORF Transcript_26814/g.63717 Transcript_26814/m.63717 type:complete len:200 (+) Transcript_26814:462-1061(+)
MHDPDPRPQRHSCRGQRASQRQATDCSPVLPGRTPQADAIRQRVLGGRHVGVSSEAAHEAQRCARRVRRSHHRGCREAGAASPQRVPETPPERVRGAALTGRSPVPHVQAVRGAACGAEPRCDPDRPVLARSAEKCQCSRGGVYGWPPAQRRSWRAYGRQYQPGRAGCPARYHTAPGGESEWRRSVGGGGWEVNRGAVA